MARKKKGFNPFYFVLILVGVAFFVTSCAYGLMTYRTIHIGTGPSGHPWMDWINENGLFLLLGELALLGVCTVGVISTDSYWTKRR